MLPRKLVPKRSELVFAGRPYMVLTGGALTKLNSLTPTGMTAQIDISLTDEYPMAHAMVVISAEPA